MLPPDLILLCTTSATHPVVADLTVLLCSMAADYGFDPLGLGKDPQALRWYGSCCAAGSSQCARVTFLTPSLLQVPAGRAGALPVGHACSGRHPHPWGKLLPAGWSKVHLPGAVFFARLLALQDLSTPWPRCLRSLVSGQDLRTMQVFSAVGILNIPDWYNAGRVAQLNSFAPFSECRPCHVSHLLPCLAGAVLHAQAQLPAVRAADIKYSLPGPRMSGSRGLRQQRCRFPAGGAAVLVCLREM